MADFRIISAALNDEPTLQAAVSQAIAQNPQHAPLFTSLAQYILRLKASEQVENEAPTGKKRRLDGNGTSHQTASQGPWRSDTGSAWLILPDVSFIAPQRKKFALEITEGGIRARNSTDLLEFGLSWQNIGHVIVTPQPDKATLSFYLTVLPSSPVNTEAIVVALPNSAPKSPSKAVEASDTYVTLLSRVISTRKQVTSANASTFKSAAPQAGRKDPALHVKAFRGSKEGSLFFLDSGILWGFKKPVFFSPLEEIRGVAYTSVLQRTFNLVLSVPKQPGLDTEIEDVEFSMIDQIDFSGISEYVSSRGVQDGSLAASRRAKAMNINPPEEKDEAGGPSELEKAQREIEQAEEDAEDEEEEDYDPGSEGESEGEGSSSEEEDDSNAIEVSVDNEDEESDLVRAELGSQAASVSPDEEEETSGPSGIAVKRKLPSR